MTPSRIFLYLCLSFIGGIAIASFLRFPVVLLLVGVAGVIALIAVFWRDKRFIVMGFCILVFFAGFWRMQSTFASISGGRYVMTQKEIVLRGVIVQDPDVQLNVQNLVLKPQTVDGEAWQAPHGKMLLQTKVFQEYRYGDFIEAKGVMAEPENFDGFDYKTYLAKEDIYWVMRYPKIEFLDSGRGNIVFEKLFAVKHRARKVLQAYLSSPQSELLAALMFGDEHQLSKEFLEKLNKVGLRHLIAISGMNMTILAGIVMKFLLGLRLWRWQAFLATILFITLFILMIGAPASAVRAGIMGGLLLLAQNVGRLSSPMRAIVFASTFMLAVNPMLLRFDVGFQLSFAAIVGIILFSDFFDKKLTPIPNWHFLPLRSTLAMTFSAQIATAPILIYYFNFISFVTPFTNILVTPLNAPILQAGILFVAAGAAFPLLGFILAWPLWLMTSYIIKVTEIAALTPLPVVSLEQDFIRLVFFILSAVGALSVYFYIRREKKRQILVRDA